MGVSNNLDDAGCTQPLTEWRPRDGRNGAVSVDDSGLDTDRVESGSAVNEMAGHGWRWRWAWRWGRRGRRCAERSRCRHRRWSWGRTRRRCGCRCDRARESYTRTATRQQRQEYAGAEKTKTKTKPLPNPCSAHFPAHNQMLDLFKLNCVMPRAA